MLGGDHESFTTVYHVWLFRTDEFGARRILRDDYQSRAANVFSAAKAVKVQGDGMVVEFWHEGKTRLRRYPGLSPAQRRDCGKSRGGAGGS